MSTSRQAPQHHHHRSACRCRCRCPRPRLVVESESEVFVIVAVTVTEYARAAAPRAASRGSRLSLRASGTRSAALAFPTRPLFNETELPGRHGGARSSRRTFPSSETVRCPTSCPRLSPDNMRSPWSSRRKSSEEPSWARAGGSVLAWAEGPDGRVSGIIILLLGSGSSGVLGYDVRYTIA
jgi:hypothetical protein